MMYHLVRALINLAIRVVTRVEATGLENVPKQGAFIAAANHLGRLDVPLVYYLLKRDDVVMLVAEKYQKYAWARWLAKVLDATFVNRFNADLQALRRVFNQLKRGGAMVIAPEGTRSHNRALIQGWAGAGYLAARSGVPVVPVAVTGTEDDLVVAQLRRLRRPRLVVRIGKPFCLPPLNSREREKQLQEHTDEIMCRIAALLPSEYRGVYAEHPRLHSILQESAQTL